MKLNSILIALALGASTCLLQAQPDNQGPGGEGGQRPGRRQGGGGPGGPGGPGGMQPGGFHVIPPFVQGQLNLTDDQKKQIEALEKDTKAKLDNILTDEQKTKLKDMQENMRRRFGGQGGPGGPGGAQGGQSRGPGGKQRPPSDNQ